MTENNQELKIIFIGTPEFGAIILEGLISNGYKPILVITETDKPRGRKKIVTPPPVKLLAQKYNIPVLQPERIGNCKLEIENLHPDLVVVAAYGQIIPKDILSIPKYDCLNVHPSLLPKYRGPSPIQSAILNGDEETGVTIMLIDEKMDHGPIVAKSKIQIPCLTGRQAKSKITYSELHNESAKLGADILVKTIPDWVEGRIKPIVQNEAEATYTKLLKKEDGHIDWKNPADYIERQTRALNPEPGVFTLADDLPRRQAGKIIKIIKTSIQEQDKNGPAGLPGKTFLATNEKIAVQTGKNYLIIEELQLEGKKPTNAADFIKGHQNFIGIILK